MVKARRTPDAAPRSRRASDLTGLLFFFTGAACLLWLTWPQHALLSDSVDRGLRLLAGTGAYVIPVILMFVGAMFLVGFERLAFSHSSYGSLLLFLAYVTWRHVAQLGQLAQEPAWQPHQVEAAGGYVGAVLGTVLVRLVGVVASYLFVLMLACMGVVLVAEKPFLEILHVLFGRPATAGLAAARQGIAVVKERRATIGSRRRPDVALAGVKGLPASQEEGGRRRGFLLFRGPGADRTEEDCVPDGAATPVPPAAPPVPAEPRSPRRRQPPPDQAPIPMLAAETADGEFKLPPITLLHEAPPPPRKGAQELADKIKVLEQTLSHFNIQADVVEVAHGPTVTRYEIQLAPGIKVSKIVSLADNLAMALAAIDVRVEAPIPGKSAIGVEVPNTTPALVALRECLDQPEFWNAPSRLTFALGKDVGGACRYADLAKMPHLLVAGSTNSGKSVCLNTLIASLVYRATPAELKLLMIDPKRVELSLWDGIPHLMHPVVKDVKLAAGILRAALREMERRYDLFARMQTRNIEGYNQRVAADEKLPYLVLIVDELADLMMQAAAEVETSICRLAQLARATGIHLVIATQRPSVDVITGLIKANISSRIAFAVSSQVDSRTILDMNGAERLIGRGDMLFMPIDAAKPTRIQGCFLSEDETNGLVAYLRQQGAPEYGLTPIDSGTSDTPTSRGDDTDGDDDDLFEAAVRLVVTNGHASTSMLQRRFKIGYTRAARIVDMMQEKGIVGPPDGAKPREILVNRDQIDQMFRTGPYGVPEDLLS